MFIFTGKFYVKIGENLVANIGKCLLCDSFARWIYRLNLGYFIGIGRLFDKVRMIYCWCGTRFQFTTNNAPFANRELFHPIIQEIGIKELNYNRLAGLVGTGYTCRATTATKCLAGFHRFNLNHNRDYFARIRGRHGIYDAAVFDIGRNMQHKIQYSPPTQQIGKPRCQYGPHPANKLQVRV